MIVRPDSVTSPNVVCSTGATPSSSSQVSAPSLITHSDKRWIALFVLAPLIFAATMLALFLAVLLKRRRRNKQDCWETDSSVSSKHTIMTSKDGGRDHFGETVKMTGALGDMDHRNSSRLSIPPAIDIRSIWRSITGNRVNQSHKSRASSSSGRPTSRRDSWYSYANHFNVRLKSSALPENDAIEEEKPTQPSSKTSHGMTAKYGFPRFSLS